MINYAEVLESYIIAEEGLVDKVFDSKAFDLFANALGKIGDAGNKIGRKLNPEEYKRLDDAKAEREKKKKADIEKRKKDEENARRQYYISLNISKALDESKLNLSPYSSTKFKSSNDIENSLKKDLRIALPRILATVEVTNAIQTFCEKYNNATPEEKIAKFGHLDKKEISEKWVKSNFKIGRSLDESPEFISVEVHNTGYHYYDQYIVADIISVAAKYIDQKYREYGEVDAYYRNGWMSLNLF